jgi:N-acyl-D-amino-acid deacylase
MICFAVARRTLSSRKFYLAGLLAFLPTGCHSGAPAADYDVLIRHGQILDGSGGAPYAGDVAIRGDRIVSIGSFENVKAKREIDATGLVISPGFIDMLGQSELSLLIDNRSQSKLSQGITSEITGEGGSIAPQNQLTIAPQKIILDHYHLSIDWQDLAGYYRRLEKSGIPINLGTYVGASQVRQAVLGDVDRAPTPAELQQMESLVATAMQQRALGLSTALIYPPGHYATTTELIALAKVASKYGGIYASHMRSEGQSEMAAIDEAIRIGREANLPVEIFHLKVSGKARWGDMPKVVAKLQAARDSGLDIAADMYPYTAGATQLASSLPPWVADGGMEKLLERLRDPAIRRRIVADMARDHNDWENLYLDCGGGRGVMISAVVNPDLQPYEGKTVAEVAKAENKPEMDALFDFILADKGQTAALYFMANENDLQYGLKQPWTSIGLDAGETSLDGPLFEPHTHPRAWGSMPRFLGHYARDVKLLDLPQAVRKITSLPAQREHLSGRGLLKSGFYADVTIFDPAAILDTATYSDPNQVSKGVQYVLVNGQLEWDRGKLTDATAGRALVHESGNPRN